MAPVVVQDYDPDWPLRFQRLRTTIWPAVEDIALAIEHVGSTSVDGLAAKPIIDLDVVVPDGHMAEGIARLAGLGYVYRGDLGIPGREAFTPPRGSVPHHLYLCPSGSPALANHLAVRDFLRANSEVATAYGALKKALAAEFPDDIDAYIEGKTGFLLGILRSVGFEEDALGEIEGMNEAGGG